MYSDRFVPSRTASAGLREFSLLDAAVPPVSAAHPSSEREVRNTVETPCARLSRVSPITRHVAASPHNPNRRQSDAPGVPVASTAPDLDLASFPDE